MKWYRVTAAIVVPVFLAGAIVIVVNWREPRPVAPIVPESPCAIASPQDPAAGPNRVAERSAIPFGRAPRSWTAFGPENVDPRTASENFDGSSALLGGRHVSAQSIDVERVQVVICAYSSPEPGTDGTCEYTNASRTPFLRRSSPPAGPVTVLARRNSAYTLLAFEATTNRLLARVDTRATECPTSIGFRSDPPPDTVFATVGRNALGPINRVLDGP